MIGLLEYRASSYGKVKHKWYINAIIFKDLFDEVKC